MSSASLLNQEPRNVTFSLPGDQYPIGPLTGHTLVLYPQTHQVVWTRPRTNKPVDLVGIHFKGRRCHGCMKCTDTRPPRGHVTEVYHLRHFYNYYLKHYVPVGVYAAPTTSTILTYFHDVVTPGPPEEAPSPVGTGKEQTLEARFIRLVADARKALDEAEAIFLDMEAAATKMARPPIRYR